MRIVELLKTEGSEVYLPRANIYFSEQLKLSEKKAKEIAGMIRGLANAINGYQSVSDTGNDEFLLKDKAKFRFRTVAQAERFRSALSEYFDRGVLQHIEAKRVRPRSVVKAPSTKKKASKKK